MILITKKAARKDKEALSEDVCAEKHSKLRVRKRCKRVAVFENHVIFQPVLPNKVVDFMGKLLSL